MFVPIKVPITFRVAEGITFVIDGWAVGLSDGTVILKDDGTRFWHSDDYREIKDLCDFLNRHQDR